MRFGWRPYVPVSVRRQDAEREMQQLRKKGHEVAPVVIEGRTITRTFWGKAWCENLEHYSDYANRLPRGRTYVRNGSVVDLQIAPGAVAARVSGSSLYLVKIAVAALPPSRWKSLCRDCSGAIDSLVELLQGRFSKGVMERICQVKTGLFPSPSEIELSCSCPDWATMCKHVAAVLYGVGARLDERPELLFRLRQVDEGELVAQAGRDLPLARTRPTDDRVLASDDLAGLFGLEMGDRPARSASSRRQKPPAGTDGDAAASGRASETTKARRKTLTRHTPAEAVAAPSVGVKQAKRSPHKQPSPRVGTKPVPVGGKPKRSQAKKTVKRRSRRTSPARPTPPRAR